MPNNEKNFKRYMAASHAMQTGVALDHARGSQDGTPKHLRIGVNSAMVEHKACVALLIKKGIITDEEYLEALADAMEEEVARYKRHLKLPPGFNLG